MENKTLEIHIPKGYEIDLKMSDLRIGIIHFKEVATTCYQDLSKILFEGADTHYIDARGNVDTYLVGNTYRQPNNAPSKLQLQALLAINKLATVAHYLNRGWKPTSYGKKYYITECPNRPMNFEVRYSIIPISNDVYFKTKELALQAIEILGDEDMELTFKLQQ